MAELKTQKNKASVKQFVDSVADDKRRSDCRAVMKVMAEITGKRPKMWGSSLIGYGAYTYVNTTKKPAQWPVVALSPRKNELTVYIMPGFEPFQPLMDKLGKYRTGKSCLYIKKLEDVHMPTLKQLIKRSVAEMKRRYEVDL
ncbi:MAG: DUF1801 domain-containing protein [Myxococcales bacterium]|nr:DUF1801 domain-containing protein [Myxococcales bacterium]